jgi:hypothetical protein
MFWWAWNLVLPTAIVRSEWLLESKSLVGSHLVRKRYTRGMRISLFELFKKFKSRFVVGHGDCCLRFRVVKSAKDEGEGISRLMKCQNWR